LLKVIGKSGPASVLGLSLAAASLLGAIGVGPAGAQQKAPASQATPAPPAGAAIKPSHLAAARAVVISSGMSRSFSVIIPQFIDQISDSLTQTRPEIAQDLKDVLTNLRPEFDKQADEMTDIAAQVFAKRLNEADLNAVAAFFNSSAGKQYVATQPAVLTDIVTAMQGWQGKVSTNMMERVREEMKKKGHEI
jgi:uncharacterized protein